MTILGNLLHFGQLFNARGSNYFAQIAHVLGNFCKGVKIFHFSSGIIFWQVLQTFVKFYSSHCCWSALLQTLDKPLYLFPIVFTPTASQSNIVFRSASSSCPSFTSSMSALLVSKFNFSLALVEGIGIDGHWCNWCTFIIFPLLALSSLLHCHLSLPISISISDVYIIFFLSLKHTQLCTFIFSFLSLCLSFSLIKTYIKLLSPHSQSLNSTCLHFNLFLSFSSKHSSRFFLSFTCLHRHLSFLLTLVSTSIFSFTLSTSILHGFETVSIFIRSLNPTFLFLSYSPSCLNHFSLCLTCLSFNLFLSQPLPFLPSFLPSFLPFFLSFFI